MGGVGGNLLVSTCYLSVLLVIIKTRISGASHAKSTLFFFCFSAYSSRKISQVVTSEKVIGPSNIEEAERGLETTEVKFSCQHQKY